MTANDRLVASGRRTRRQAGRALLAVLLVLCASLAATTLPATAALRRTTSSWSWASSPLTSWRIRSTTTTTTKPSTTTTTKATTTTSAPTTTTSTTAPPVTTTSTSTTVAPSTTTTTTTPPAPQPCGGVTLPKAGGGTWQCSFSDEFDGTSLDRTKWVPQESAKSGFGTGVDCFVDDPDNVSVAGGALRLTVRKEAAPFACGRSTMEYTAGMVSTWGTWSQAYGRYEIRARFSDVTVKGVHGALWLYPKDTSSYVTGAGSSEIDIAEVFSTYADRAIPYLHYLTSGPTSALTNNWCMVDTTQFHTYVAEWTTTSIRILIDGKVCVDHVIAPVAPLAAPQPFDQPHILLLTQGLGSGGNAFDAATTPLPATTQVDYVRVWK